MTAIVLSALEVPREVVLQDYLRSNDYHRLGYAALRRKLGESGLMRDPSLLGPLLEQRPEYLLAGFEEAERRYGSFGGFLARGLDFGESALRRLGGVLLG